MSIYGIFAVHGLIDVFTFIGTPLPPKADYMSAAVAFAWYGLAFQYHASMVSKLGTTSKVQRLQKKATQRIYFQSRTPLPIKDNSLFH